MRKSQKIKKSAAKKAAKNLVMRDGKPAMDAFSKSMLQILNPLPKKKRAR